MTTTILGKVYPIPGSRTLALGRVPDDRRMPFGRHAEWVALYDLSREADPFVVAIRPEWRVGSVVFNYEPDLATLATISPNAVELRVGEFVARQEGPEAMEAFRDYMTQKVWTRRDRAQHSREVFQPK
jgi:hypothetical protein